MGGGGGGGGGGEVFNKIAPFLLINFGAEKEREPTQSNLMQGGEISRGAAVQGWRGDG